MEIKKFENSMIAFDFKSEMVNATDIIKAFPEKKMNNFLRAKQTKAFIEVLESKTQKSVLDIKHGGYGHGTWMQKRLALKFAA